MIIPDANHFGGYEVIFNCSRIVSRNPTYLISPCCHWNVWNPFDTFVPHILLTVDSYLIAVDSPLYFSFLQTNPHLQDISFPNLSIAKFWNQSCLLFSPHCPPQPIIIHHISIELVNLFRMQVPVVCYPHLNWLYFRLHHFDTKRVFGG